MAGLTLRRSLPGLPDRVWVALTDATALAAWFWPASLRPVAALDARPGGAYLIEAPGRMAVRGSCRVVEPPYRLELDWRWDGEPDQTVVRIRLSAVDGATALTLEHDGFPDETSRDNHIQGWSDCLDRLPGYLTRAAPAGRA